MQGSVLDVQTRKVYLYKSFHVQIHEFEYKWGEKVIVVFVVGLNGFFSACARKAAAV